MNNNYEHLKTNEMSFEDSELENEEDKHNI